MLGWGDCDDLPKPFCSAFLASGISQIDLSLFPNQWDPLSPLESRAGSCPMLPQSPVLPGLTGSSSSGDIKSKCLHSVSILKASELSLKRGPVPDEQHMKLQESQLSWKRRDSNLGLPDLQALPLRPQSSAH